MWTRFYEVAESTETIYFTSYNPEEGQTDSTPCIAGGTGFDLCKMYGMEQRPIALSQDMVEWTGRGTYKKGEIIRLESVDYPNDWRCNGEFIVSDSMNKRFKKRGDIFFMDKKDNISCTAKIYRQ